MCILYENLEHFGTKLALLILRGFYALSKLNLDA